MGTDSMSDDVDDIFNLLGNVAEIAGSVIQGISSVVGAISEGVSAVTELAGPALEGAASGASQIVDMAAQGAEVITTGDLLVESTIDVVALTGQVTTPASAVTPTDQPAPPHKLSPRPIDGDDAP
jgi:hypothetical protein